ncbi:MAG: transcriptional repressor [Thermoflexales bacterium]|nr:transcriptional repressor [Thermoflexales bacterium]
MTHCHTLIEQLRQRGRRITPQREMVIKVIAHSGRHMTAEDVFEAVQARSRAINLATIYRTLDFLVEQGLASRAHLGGSVVYATTQHGPHIHMVCERCGHIADAELEQFQPLFERIQSQYGFACNSQHLAIPGLCAGCQKMANSK